MSVSARIERQSVVGQNIAGLYTKLSQAGAGIGESELVAMWACFGQLVEEFENTDKEIRPPSHTMQNDAYFTGKFVDGVRDSMKKFEDLYYQIKNGVEIDDSFSAIALKAIEDARPSASKDKKGLGIVEKQSLSHTSEQTRMKELRKDSDGAGVLPLPTLGVGARQTQERRDNAFGQINQMRLEPPANVRKNTGLIRKFQYVLDELETKIEGLRNRRVSSDVVKEKYRLAETVFMQYMEEFPDDDLTEVFYALRDAYSNIPGIENKTTTLPFTLPSIEIPVFTGKFVEWETFRELFEQLVMEQPISNTQKMCVLKSKIRGEAARKIAKLPVRDENFETAWNLLSEHYSNNRATTSLYFKSILDAPAVFYNSQSVRRFAEVVNESLQGLSALQLDAQEMYQAFVCYVLQRKLDENLRIQFEQHLGKSREIPKVDSLMEFLNQMHYSLEASQQFIQRNEGNWVNPSGVKVSDGAQRKGDFQGGRIPDAKEQTTKGHKCVLGCLTWHPLYRCSKFRNLEIKERWDRVMDGNSCSRCLGSGHTKRFCTTKLNCKICNGEHHSLLHREKSGQKSAVVNNKIVNDNTCVLLATAVVQVKNGDGQWVDCRILLDSGSQVCLMTKSFRNRLNLSGESTRKEIEGLANHKSVINERVGVNLRSRTSDYSASVDALVIKNILSNVPESRVKTEKFAQNVVLADPQYNVPRGVDMLVGAEIFFDVLASGQLRNERNGIRVQETLLGWVVSGPAIMDRSDSSPKIVATIHKGDEVLRKFWEIEEVPQMRRLTVDEKECEEIFDNSVKLAADGKFQVKLPFKRGCGELGSSAGIARRRFFALEKKLEKQESLKAQYHQFLRTYLDMGHMEKLTESPRMEDGYYLPHHCVLRPESSTTKLRVVFDASCKTTSNVSLNDVLYTGPKVQENLFNILLRFRRHRYVFSADIEKMYRQIWVEDCDTKFQRIFWRWNDNEPIGTYVLKTVTYGTAAAPYLAVKCLETIAKWNKDEYPMESEAIGCDFYVDDLMTGGDCLESVKAFRYNIARILQRYGMPLRKWCANHEQILDRVDEKDVEKTFNLESGLVKCVKALGISWSPSSDVFSFNYHREKITTVTKRTILGEISRLFDPLGLIGPVVVLTKILLQDLWKLKVDWDDVIDNDVCARWIRIKENLIYLNEVRVPRHVCCVKPVRIQLCGFSDASMKAYGAAVYVRSIDSEGNVSSKLATSKSRVAPIKVITLPRLELCAGVLLVELMKAVLESLKVMVESADVYYYTDSTIVLNWLRLDPAVLQIFVSNRVSFIQSMTELSQWRHVRSQENPADLLSRGLLGRQIVENELWFEGPAFLKELIEKETTFEQIVDVPDVKKAAKILVIKEGIVWWKTINHRNKFSVLQNVVAMVLKFANIAKKGGHKSVLHYRKEALKLIIRDVQQEYFSADLDMMQAKGKVHEASHIRTLCPILDSSGILRVGGRLENSALLYEAKHPILLPYKCKVTEMIVEQLHKEHLHVGPQGLLAIVRQQFWPLRGRLLAKRVVNRCYRCFRVEPRKIHQMMGNLPGDRVIRTRPFLNVGIDYLGPIEIHHKVRGKRIDKSYVCVFVCFATKAAHLEVASDLTSAAFIGALKRFVARRGCPNRIYSDNGTNFVGASNSLHEIYKLFAEKQHKGNVDEFCLQRDIEWINIPARSPHVGGLWEACVKSVKKHFHRAIEGIMTYEELCTLIVQIEAVLNSRPLTPLSEDPNDNSVLTPGHFLIGEAFTTIVDSSENKCYKGLRDHWRAVQENANAFWERWSLEYLSELNKRYKWNKPQSNIQPGTLVLLKEDNLPPLSWRRGRVIRTIIGSDGLCRMVDVRTSTGETKRSVQNVCPFPTEIYEEIVGEDEAKTLNAAYNGNKKPTICKKKSSVSPTLRRERIKNKNFIFCIISLLCVTNPIRAKIDIIKFKEKSSIFFEEVSTVGLTKSSWDIVVHINISKYAASMATINNAMADYGVFVDKVLEKQQVFMRNELEEAYHRVQDRNELIMSSMPERRSKRAALAFVGGIFHSLFGLMDEEHAEVLSEKIRNAAENQEYLLSLERNYTSIQDITSEVIKKQNEVIFDNIQKFKGSFDSLSARMNNLADREAIVRKATSLLATFEAFGEIQKNLITVMTNTKGSLLHELISVKRLKDEILRIRSTVNKRLRLPTEKPMELSKLAHVTTRATVGFILFNVRLPLINTDVFTSYAIHAYPEMHDELSVRIQPSNSFMLIDERKTMFYYISEENWAHCQKTKEMMICPQIHPIYNTRNTQSCEVQLFLKTRRVPSSCKVEIKAWANYWKQVQAPNTWIFSVSTQMGAESICDGKRHAVIIEGQGLIKLQPNCHLETEETTLWAYDRYSSDADFMIPNINLSSFLPSLTHLKLDNEIEIYKLSDIPKATSILGWPTHLNIHHLAHYGFSVTTCIIIIVIIIAVIWILKKVCNMSSRYLPASIVLPRLR